MFAGAIVFLPHGNGDLDAWSSQEEPPEVLAK
jgi:hypothetical protein